ncbi:type II restriction endonuclease [Candidatus Pacearchaeota archaeon]|nr:type II restriction endonuclease [Candidatus Pacearchaeota archaeon]
MADLVRIGSETAKGGFANEDIIVKKFNSWKSDNEANKWLKLMGYELSRIRKVEALRLHGHKTDVQVLVKVWLKIGMAAENISVKKTNSDADYNQIDKRWVKNYIKMWNIPDGIVELLKIFSGEISPKDLLKQAKITKKKYDSLRDKRRFFLDEFKPAGRKAIINFFKKNKILIVTDIIKGRDKFAADWILVTRYDRKKDETSWVLADINKAMSIFGEGDVKISPKGSLSLGRITLQRKGGDGGRETGNMLQFKIRPCDLFRY